MAKRQTPKAPPTPPKAPMAKPKKDFLAGFLARSTRDAYGPLAAHTLDTPSLGRPRGWVATRNIAIERAIQGPGLPLGRIVEVAGWESAGKSTFCDQVMAACQAAGGLAILADTEGSRDAEYMASLGCDPESVVSLNVDTVEALFAQVELSVRQIAALNAQAWYEALRADGVSIPKPAQVTFDIYDGPSTGGGKPVDKVKLVKWGREQAAALFDWQQKRGLQVTGVRDAESRALLKPMIMPSEDPKERERLYKDFLAGQDVPGAEPADRPVVIVWDSVGGTPSVTELEGSAYDTNPATAARAIKKNLRRLTMMINDEAVLFLMANQKYQLIGQTGFRGHVPSESYGGSGIKFFTSIRIELKRGKDIPVPGQADDWRNPPMGQEVHALIVKNRMGAPKHRGSYALIFGRGTDNAWALYNDFKERGLISVGGAWSKFADPDEFYDKSWQGGWMGLSNLLQEEPDLYEKMVARYMSFGEQG